MRWLEIFATFLSQIFLMAVLLIVLVQVGVMAMEWLQ